MTLPLKIISIIAVVCFILFLLSTIRFLLLVKKSIKLAVNAVPYQRMLPDASMKILVLGDSTAVGTGSEKPELSTAGRLGATYPAASVTNLAVNGLKLKGLIQIINTLNPKEYFDIILVQIGANDIMRMTSMDDVAKEADQVFAQLSKQTNTLIVLHAGDIGQAQIFPHYIRPILSKRSFEMRDIYIHLAAKYGVKYVDLIESPARNLLLEYPNKYYAQDFLHLNGAGYGLWFDEIQKALER